MLSKTLGAAVQGIDAITVTIEVSIEWGSGFTIVGLPDTAVKESGERTRCAIIEAGFERVSVDMGAYRRIYAEIDEFFNPTPIFCLAAYK